MTAPLHTVLHIEPDPDNGFDRLEPVVAWLKVNGIDPSKVVELSARHVEPGCWRASVTLHLDTTPFPYDLLKEMGEIE